MIFAPSKLQSPDDMTTLGARFPMPNLKQMTPFKPVVKGTGKQEIPRLKAKPKKSWLNFLMKKPEIYSLTLI